MENFTFYNPTKIHFGSGKLDILGQIVKKYGNTCMLVTTTKKEKVLLPLYEKAHAILQNSGVNVYHFDEAVPNPTVQSIEKAISIVKKKRITVIIGLGGGSSIDTAKSIALFYQPDKIDWNQVYSMYTSPFEEYKALSNPILPLISIPTTSGTGSELTQAMVISDLDTKEKVCIFHDKIFPKETIIDVELTQTLPPRLTAITGFDAFTHAFESYMREEANVYTKMLGLKALRLIIDSLPPLVNSPDNHALRENMSIAEMFAGISLSNAAATIPHPLSEIIGGIRPDIAHGQCLACLYPGYVRFEIKKSVEKCADIARLFNEELIHVDNKVAASTLPIAIEGFLDQIGIKQTLTELGVSGEEKDQLKNHFLLSVLPFGTKEELTQIMTDAF